MPIYVYETIPRNPGEKPAIYEIEQSMRDKPLTAHPYTGQPMRRVILGGFGILSSTGGRRSLGGESGGCGLGCCCG